MKTRSLFAIATLIAASTPMLSGTAAEAADTTIGETFTEGFDCNDDYTHLQTGPSSYSVPAGGGVITSWNAGATSPYEAAFRVGRADERSGTYQTYSITAAPAPITVNPGASQQQQLRIPVQAGDVIGTYIPEQDEANEITCNRNVSGGYDYTWAGAVGDAKTLITLDEWHYYQYNVSAVVEPDADKDGFGDTTQDQCPTDATTQEACEEPADTTAPQTTITQLKADKIKAGAKGNKAKASVVARFGANEASTYECSVDGGAFRTCSSPLRTNLKKGRHSIAVRAIDTAGNVDATPAKRTLTIKQAEKK